MPRQTWIASRIRSEISARNLGSTLSVVEMSNWANLGSATFSPGAVVCHHDASSISSGDAGALSIIRFGRSDLPGPLSQIQGSRRSGKIHVIAAGRANHAGAGLFRGLSGNSVLLGIEWPNNGLGEPWTEIGLLAYKITCIALLKGIGKDWTWLVAHKGYATPVGRKPDPAGGPFGSSTQRDIEGWRQQVRAIWSGGGLTNYKLGERPGGIRLLNPPMSGSDVGELQKELNRTGFTYDANRKKVASLGVDNVAGGMTMMSATVFSNEVMKSTATVNDMIVGSETANRLKAYNPTPRSWFDMASEEDLDRVVERALNRVVLAPSGRNTLAAANMWALAMALRGATVEPGNTVSPSLVLRMSQVGDFFRSWRAGHSEALTALLAGGGGITKEDLDSFRDEIIAAHTQVDVDAVISAMAAHLQQSVATRAAALVPSLEQEPPPLEVVDAPDEL